MVSEYGRLDDVAQSGRGALLDVAKWLGYANAGLYLDAIGSRNKAEVARRLRKALGIKGGK